MIISRLPGLFKIRETSLQNFREGGREEQMQQPSMSFSRSVEELHRNIAPRASGERRARSTSPVKDRRTQVDLTRRMSTGAEWFDNDLASLCSANSGTLSPSQLKELSKSPMSNRIHITSPKNSKYVIPIPLTLRLPPKLSSKSPDPSSPLLSKDARRRSRGEMLVYNGTAYEKLENLYDLSLDDGDILSGKYNAKGGPPSVWNNSRKDVKRILNTFLVASDELSTIDEASIGSRSAKSSIKVAFNPKSSRENDSSIDKGTHSMVAQKGAHKPRRKKPCDDAQFESTSRLNIEENKFKMSIPCSPINARNPGTNENELKSNVEEPIKKNMSNLSTSKSTNAVKDNPRSISNSSANSLLSNATGISWDSIQKSLDIAIDSLKRGDELPSTKKMVLSIRSNSNKSKSSSSIRKSSYDDEFEFAITKSNQIKEDKKEELRENGELVRGAANNQLVNGGAGKDFVFPNNETNITNSKDLPDLPSAKGSFKSKVSRDSFRSSSGQIEIPVLTDNYRESFDIKLKQLKIDSLKDNGGNRGYLNNIDPIELPSKAAKVIANDFFADFRGGLDELESDLCNSSFNTLYHHTMHGNGKGDINKEKGLPLIPILPPSKENRRSRHTRHKSMCTLDFDDEKFKMDNSHTLISSSKPKHVKAKSLGAEKAFLSKKTDSLPTNGAENKPLKVIEPPRMVHYSVDFKESSFDDNFPNTLHRPPEMANDASNNENMKRGLTTRGISSLKSSNLDISCSVHPRRQHPYKMKLDEINYPAQGFQRLRSATSSTITNSSARSSAFNPTSSSTAASDTASVIIDLTRDKYDLCLIQRNNSTQSYRSVIEEQKDGNKVEVVLVEDDETGSSESFDDLASIYSKYAKDKWVFRSNSSSTTVSNGSTSSSSSRLSSRTQKGAQLMNQKSQFSRLRKTPSRICEEDSPSNSDPLSNCPDLSHKSERKVPVENNNTKSASDTKPVVVSQPDLRFTGEDRFFDYTSNSYDFTTFMQQQARI